MDGFTREESGSCKGVDVVGKEGTSSNWLLRMGSFMECLREGSVMGRNERLLSSLSDCER